MKKRISNGKYIDIGSAEVFFLAKPSWQVSFPVNLARGTFPNPGGSPESRRLLFGFKVTRSLMHQNYAKIWALITVFFALWEHIIWVQQNIPEQATAALVNCVWMLSSVTHPAWTARAKHNGAGDTQLLEPWRRGTQLHASATVRFWAALNLTWAWGVTIAELEKVGLRLTLGFVIFRWVLATSEFWEWLSRNHLQLFPPYLCPLIITLTQIFKNLTATQKSTGGKLYVFLYYVSEQFKIQLKNHLILYYLQEKCSEAL